MDEFNKVNKPENFTDSGEVSVPQSPNFDLAPQFINPAPVSLPPVQPVESPKNDLVTDKEPYKLAEKPKKKGLAKKLASCLLRLSYFLALQPSVGF